MTEVSRPPTEELHALTATQAARLVRSREISPVELVQHLLDRAASVDPKVQAWQTLDPEGALATARAAEQALRRSPSELPPLYGVPFGAKDIFDSAGLPTSASFAPYANRVPSVDAEPIARLKQAGAILLGKMVTTQFAQADPSKTRNPWQAERTPGGSSSGSAAGVAAQLVPLALGSQTAGSVLRPAAYNGVVGFKPTYGRISKRGVFPLAWSLDHVGVLSRSVEDCELFLQIEADVPPSARRVEAPRLGVVREAMERAAPRVRDHVRGIAELLAAQGATVEEVSLGEPLDLVLAVHHVIMQTEAAAVHWQLLDQFPGAHAPRLRAYVEVGRLLPGTHYLHALRLRQRIAGSIQQGFSRVDALLLPTATDVAPGRETTGDPSLQAPFSLVGFPSLSLPCGLSDDPQLPLAIQLAGAPGRDSELLGIGRWCEARLSPMPSPTL